MYNVLTDTQVSAAASHLPGSLFSSWRASAQISLSLGRFPSSTHPYTQLSSRVSGVPLQAISHSGLHCYSVAFPTLGGYLAHHSTRPTTTSGEFPRLNYFLCHCAQIQCLAPQSLQKCIPKSCWKVTGSGFSCLFRKAFHTVVPDTTLLRVTPSVWARARMLGVLCFRSIP